MTSMTMVIVVMSVIMNVAMIYSPECKETELGTEYIGKVSVTKTGRTCQRWDTQSPQPHSHGTDAR